MNTSEEITQAVQAIMNRPKPMMRVFEIDYVCGICHRGHTAEPYFFSDEHDVEALHANTMESLRDEKTMLVILKGDAMVRHHDRGDLMKLLTDREQDGHGQIYRVRDITMTGEDRFICDECGREFSSLPERLMHMGKHPRNGHRIGPYECAVR